MGSINQTVKVIQATLFVSILYGWMIPTVLLNNVIQSLLPTSQLSSTDWVIEEGIENTRWDFVTIDGIEEALLPQEEVEDRTENESSDLSVATPNDSTKSTSEDNTVTDTQAPSNTSKEAEDSELYSTGDATQTLASKKRFLKLNVQKPVSRKRKQRTRRGKCTVDNPNISKKGTLSYHVPKKVLKHYSTHWKEASRLAHLSWAMNEQGDRMGVRIRAISCQSPLKFTGIRRGDVVVSINGMSVHNDKDLLKVYGRLLFWKNMNVTVKRGMKLVTIKYSIV